MAEQEQRQPGGPEQQDPSQVEQLFDDPTWKQQAQQPGTLEQIGHRLDTVLSSKSQSLQSYISDIKLAYAMLRDPGFHLDHTVKVVVIIALLYLISPVDLLPDAIPVLGLLDDLLVIGYALRQAATELERYRVLKQDTRTTPVQ
jgi:uncharacterized membrane protein YkvA (DUF1232 family)